MNILISISAFAIVLFSLFLMALGIGTFLATEISRSFMNAFASSAKAHYTELTIRIIVGTSFILYSPFMRYSEYFLYFGWIVIITTVGLFTIPWRWHYKFASMVIPIVLRFLRFYGIVAFLSGILVLVCLVG